MDFYCHQLIINNETCQKRHFEQLIKTPYSTHKTEVLEKLDCVIQDDFAKLYFKSGDPTPRSPEVVDVQTHVSTENLRALTQVEPTLNYGVIDFSTGRVWLPYRAKSVFENAMSFLHQTNYHLKPIICEKEFLERISSLKEIKFGIARDNLLNSQSTLGKSLEDEILGYGANYAELTLKFDKKTSMKEKITGLLGNKSAYKKLVIAGQDDGGLDLVFDLRAISTKLNIDAPEDDNGMIIAEQLFNDLIRKLKNET
jgi:hypothetical protein